MWMKFLFVLDNLVARCLRCTSKTMHLSTKKLVFSRTIYNPTLVILFFFYFPWLSREVSRVNVLLVAHYFLLVTFLPCVYWSLLRTQYSLLLAWCSFLFSCGSFLLAARYVMLVARNLSESMLPPRVKCYKPKWNRKIILKIVWIKITTIFKRRVSIVLWSFSS